MTTNLPKPTSLDITCENNKLVGIDSAGNRWHIRWCGNGPYSHWVLIPESNPDSGYYEYTYSGPEHEREARSSLLEKQIRAAEHKYKVYS